MGEVVVPRFGRMLGGGTLRVIHAPIFSGANLDFDLRQNRGRVMGATGTAASFLSTTRASTAYADDSAGNWSAFASNIPRITDKGLLVEESRTNSIRNNSMQGAVAGTPGTVPTGWASGTTPSGLTRSIVGVGTEDGIDYIDINWSGTATSGAAFGLDFVGTGAQAASQSQIWAGSVFLRLIAGSMAGIDGINLGILERASDGSHLNEDLSAAILPTSAALSSQRTTLVSTLENASTAYVKSRLVIDPTNGAAIDITLRIGWPQLELGAFATSPIRTTSAAATRAADVITLASVAGLPSQFSAVVEIDIPQVNGGVNWRMLEAYDGSTSAGLRCDGSSAGIAYLAGDGAVTVGTITTGRHKMAARFFANDLQVAFDGVLGTRDTSASALGALTRFDIGNTQVASPRQINGWIRRLGLFPASLTDAQLQALST